MTSIIVTYENQRALTESLRSGALIFSDNYTILLLSLTEDEQRAHVLCIRQVRQAVPEHPHFITCWKNTLLAEGSELFMPQEQELVE